MSTNMNVRNCRKCKRLFNYVTGPVLCQECRGKMEEKFQEVKKYVEENPGADIRRVSEACEVEVMQIHQWIKEERLTFAPDSPIGIPCERCGTTIRSGRFCDRCKAEMTNSFNRAIGNTPRVAAPLTGDNEEKRNPKIRFLN